MTGHHTNVVRSTTARGALVVATLGLIGMSYAAVSKGPASHLAAPENVAATTLTELKTRMERHGNSMSTLVKAVVLLDRPTISTLAGRIADEEVIARSEGQGLDRWRPLLPKAFFVEQDALRAAAHGLAAAAAHGEPDEVVADRFAVVTRACVSCHGVYLHGRPELPSQH